LLDSRAAAELPGIAIRESLGEEKPWRGKALERKSLGDASTR
jgi:hypothetical protein